MKLLFEQRPSEVIHLIDVNETEYAKCNRLLEDVESLAKMYNENITSYCRNGFDFESHFKSMDLINHYQVTFANVQLEGLNDIPFDIASESTESFTIDTNVETLGVYLVYTVTLIYMNMVMILESQFVLGKIKPEVYSQGN